MGDFSQQFCKKSPFKKDDKRKKSEAKTEGQHGPTYVRNPDKIMGDGRTKEEWVRSGDRKDYNKEAAKSWGISLGGALLGFFGGKKLMK
jgi:hypothetical protein